MIETVITAGGLSALIIEGIKYLIRLIIKDSSYNFPTKFYLIAIPVLNVLVTPLMALLLIPGYTMPLDWVSFVRSAALALIGSLISVISYEAGIKPLKNYRDFWGI